MGLVTAAPHIRQLQGQGLEGPARSEGSGRKTPPPSGGGPTGVSVNQVFPSISMIHHMQHQVGGSRLDPRAAAQCGTVPPSPAS